MKYTIFRYRCRSALRFVAVFLFAMIHTALPASAAAPPACPELDRAACTASPACISVLAEDKSYQCRQIANECQAFRQSRFHANGALDTSYDVKAACEARNGCSFVPGGPCYGPPGVTCVCGGGPPPDCVPADAGPSVPPT